ncbi:MAG: D-xylose ABC transporter substrate-binding protein [Chloroflexota bacterium]
MRYIPRFGRVAAAGLVVAVTVGASPLLNPAHAARPQAASGKVGFLFSDFTTSARWAFDRDYFKAALHAKDPGASVVVQDAKTDQTRQLNEAKSLLTSGVKVLIDVPVDSVQAKAIVQAAHSNSPRVPVIAYDRLINDVPVDAYTSFNGFAVGKQQARYLVKHVKKGGTIVSIAGSTTDNNAHLFHDGAFSVLQPLINKGVYKLAYDKYTPNWAATAAQAEMASALNKLNNKVDGVLVANDGMAGGVVAALKAQGLAGKIPVTGQDATVAGLQQIVQGTQSMTVYKPLRKLARAAAIITDLFLNHKKFSTSNTTANGAGKIPTILIPVVTVTKSNIKSTVIADGFVKRAELCAGIAGACAKAGI